jgi:DNA invertase Pin-like site-specific DNA recombinase
MTKTVALYLRVSADEQTVEMQRRELMAAIERHGWRVVGEFVDEGISGSKGRDQRPAFDRLCKAIVRHEFDIVAAWSVDRLGRSLQDLVGFLGEVHGAGVDLYLDRQGLDTSTLSTSLISKPAGDNDRKPEYTMARIPQHNAYQI